MILMLMAILGVDLQSNPVNAAGGGFTVFSATGSTYTHDGSETTTDTFTYRAFDGTSGSTVTVTINITPNDCPSSKPNWYGHGR